MRSWRGLKAAIRSSDSCNASTSMSLGLSGATSSTLVGPTRPRQVDEDPSHDTGRGPEEVSPTLPLRLSLIDESDVGLVHEGRCLQRMTCRFTTHVRSRQTSEFVVEERYELVERFSPAVAGGDEQLRHRVELVRDRNHADRHRMEH